MENIDEKIILLQDSRYSVLPNSATRWYSNFHFGGTRTFTFRPQSIGEAKVHLGLKAEWEKEISPFDQFVVFIQMSCVANVINSSDKEFDNQG
jgi:predicted secreted protein